MLTSFDEFFETGKFSLNSYSVAMGILLVIPSGSLEKIGGIGGSSKSHAS